MFRSTLSGLGGFHLARAMRTRDGGRLAAGAGLVRWRRGERASALQSAVGGHA